MDGRGTWRPRQVDEAGLWEADSDVVSAYVDARVTEALAALAEHRDGRVVIVTNEVGLGVVPEHRSGRLFRDLLGVVNQRFGRACDEVHLVVAGRVLVL